MRRSIHRPITTTAIYALLLAGVFAALFPFWYMFVTSLKPQSYIFEIPPRLWPAHATGINYVKAVAKDSFGRYFLNSAVTAAATTAGTVLVSSMLSFAFARLRFPLREPLFYTLLAGMMIPPVMLIIPQFIVARQLHLLDRLAGLVVVYIAMNLPLQTFLLRGFFEGIPVELEESAKMNGAGNWLLYRKIIMPLSGAGIAVVTIFSFVFAWDEFAWAHVAIKEAAKRTLPIAIAFFQTQHKTEWGIVFAASIISLVPVVAIFLTFQRYFTQGISTTGLKG